MKRTPFARTLALAGLLAATASFPFTAHGQGREPPALAPSTDARRLHGAIATRWDYYDMASPSGHAGRSFLHIGGAMTIPLGQNAELPISLTAVSVADDRMMPSMPELVSSVIDGPGSVLLQPRVGWARGSLGRFAPRVSTLSGEGVPILGAAVDLHPGNVRLMVAAGQSNAWRFAGSNLPTRTLFLSTLEVGSDTGSLVRLSLIHAKDTRSTTSDSTQPLGEGLLLSTGFVGKIGGLVTIEGEVAGSADTRDVSSWELSRSDQIAPDVLRLHSSTRLDYAAMLGATATADRWELGARASYIGPGYSPLASAFSDPDRLELASTGRLALFDRRVAIHGSLGYRSENLSRLAGGATHRFTTGASLSAQITESISLAATWNSFLRGYHQGITAGPATTLSRSISLTPTLWLPSDGMNHMVIGTIAIDDFDDRLLDGSRRISSSTTGASVDYIGSFIERPLTIDVGSTYTRLVDPTFGSTTISARAGASYRFAAPRLSLSIGNCWSSRRASNGTTEQSLTMRGSAGWDITSDMKLSISISASPFAGSSTPPFALASSLTRTF